MSQRFSIKLIAACLVLLLASPAVFSAKVTANAESLVGTWNIYDSNNTLIDSINISVVVSRKTTARFSFSQVSQNSNSSYQGLLINDTIFFDLINLGTTQTYMAEIDFDIGGGPGLQMINQLASCTVVGDEKDQVKKRNRARLSNDSSTCDGTVINDASLNVIKIAKDGVNLGSVPVAGNPSEDLTNKTANFDDRLSGAWAIRAKKSRPRRIIIKDVTANHFGHQFIYRVIDNRTKLSNLTQSSFLSGNRTGFFIDDYMVVNTSVFAGRDELLLLKINKKKGSGKELRTPNGDCLNLKAKSATSRICTPNASASPKHLNNSTKRFENRRTSKVNSNATISF